MEYTIPYTNWEGKPKVWNVQKEGVFFVQATERLYNPDGTFLNDSCLGRFQTAYDANQVVKLLRIARPDWAKKIRAIKAPCIFDGFKAFVNVESWL